MYLENNSYLNEMRTNNNLVSINMAEIDLNALVDKISKLPSKDHEPIYVILKKNNVQMTISDSNVLFLATKCEPDVLEQIVRIVNTCYENMISEQKYEQEYKSIESEIVRRNIETDSNPNVNIFRKNEVVEMNHYNKAKLDKMKKQDEERQKKNIPIRQTLGERSGQRSPTAATSP